MKFTVDWLKDHLETKKSDQQILNKLTDIGYELKDEKIIIGEGDKWLEILGCGMVHPNVLKNVNVNPDKYQGYASVSYTHLTLPTIYSV